MIKKSAACAMLALTLGAAPLYAATEGFIDSMLKFLPEWSMRPYFSLTVWQWIGLACFIVLGLVIRKLIRIFMKGIRKIAETRSKTDWDDMFVEAFTGPTGTLVAAGVWYLAISILKLEKDAAALAGKGLQIIVSIALIVLAYRLTKVLTAFLYSLAAKSKSDLDDQLMPVVDKTLRVLVLVFGSLIALQNLGVNVVSALAGLGIGGLAFALAAQDTAANMFGSLTIFMDKPFKIGDWIKVGGTTEGIVESIGLRTLRIRTFGKSLVSLPNSVVANSAIENFSERPYRRIYTTIGVTYGSTASQIEKLVEEIKNIIKKNSFAVEEGMQVSFVEYAASSLDIMIYFFVKVSSWTEELQAKQEVYLAVMKAVEDLGLGFAFPTQTIHVESMPKQ